ncbi:catalase [Podospora aff. communis PSN243]|uniref:Catalase n=1 Tax=Podospora aff. communis PSN243 TaxID=3040156 RepID=A0AAV9H8L0_9PEZI|nr:catalase [Podospora aff. communis PSN243]
MPWGDPRLGGFLLSSSVPKYHQTQSPTKLIANLTTQNKMDDNSPEHPVYTTSNSHPMDSSQKYQSINNGPLLLQDFHLLDLLAHFDRERIPERVVHAKGAGAYGEFEVTHDISDITSIDMFNQIGKKTPVLTRFSTVGGEKGSSDTARDPRGFSIKFYTKEGNWDWVFNNTPVFFIRDPTLFPVFIHTQKRNPQTNLRDPTMFWDYLSSHPESIHQVMTLFSDRGTPFSFRHMNGYSGHTFKLTQPSGSYVYVQTHLLSNQGIRNFSSSSAAAAADPDHHTADLFNAIASGDHPSWTVYLQVLTPAQARSFPVNIFDLTKVWPHALAPLRPVGKLTLNRNPQNYFAEIEQAAFSPSHLVPGVEPSADPVLQARLFSYPDTQRHRLGTNYDQIPVNRAAKAWCPFQRDGAMRVDGNLGATPGYENTVGPGPGVRYAAAGKSAVTAEEEWEGGRVKSLVFGEEVGEEDYVQARGLWEVLGREEGHQARFVENVGEHLAGAKRKVRERTYEMFERVDGKLGRRIRDATEGLVKGDE